MTTLQAGDTFYNPVTRERAITLEAPAENPERRLVSEVHLDPGAAVVGEHLHPSTHETFEVLEGRLAYRLDGREGEIGPGERIEVPAGSWHDWWHPGEGKTVCRITVSPGERFVEMIRSIWGLALDGKTNDKGMPGLLQLAAIGAEFDDEIVFKSPPPAVQRVLFPPLAGLARRRGYRGIYPRYAGMGSAGTPEQARSGEGLVAEFAPGAGPPR